MWMATDDGGLVAVTYGPSRVTAKVATGVEATITQETEYPFEGTIHFTVDVTSAERFPLTFRIPAWADETSLTIDGETYHPQAGTLHRVDRIWHSRDCVILSLPMKIRTERRYKDAVAVLRGPLYFALKIGGDYRQLRHYFKGSADWEIRPTTTWNVGLVLDTENPEKSFQLRRNPIQVLPFVGQGEPVFMPGAEDFTDWDKEEPVVLTARARVIPEWGMDPKWASAADPPESPVRVDGKDFEVELIPYGCSRLRIAEFPVIRP
jgi:hypothetical protein